MSPTFSDKNMLSKNVCANLEMEKNFLHSIATSSDAGMKSKMNSLLVYRSVVRERSSIALQQAAKIQTLHNSSPSLKMIGLTIGTYIYLNSETVISSGNTYAVSML